MNQDALQLRSQYGPISFGKTAEITCHERFRMGVRKVSNSQSDLRGQASNWYWRHSIGRIRIPISFALQLWAYTLHTKNLSTFYIMNNCVKINRF